MFFEKFIALNLVADKISEQKTALSMNQCFLGILMSDITKQELNELAKEFRYIIADLICKSGWGHLGGTYSLVEIIITLYWRIMKYDPKNPKWEDRDRLVLSKGHAGPVLYIALAYQGFFPIRELLTVNQEKTRLPSHCDALRTPGLDMTAGSLGQGLSCACGLALAAKIDDKGHDVFCIIGDGDSNEGQVWEASMFAGHKNLDNLICIHDYNKCQVDGTTDEICTLEPLVDKWRAFNWEVFEINGHDWDQVYETIQKARAVKGKPAMIIAHTLKGKGHCDYEDKVNSHSVTVKSDEEKENLLSGLAPLDFDWSQK